MAGIDSTWRVIAATRNSTRLCRTSSLLLSLAHQVLCLEHTGLGPATCRAIAKGIIARFEGKKAEDVPPISLFLSGNEAIGDAGVAALAAALKTIATGESTPILFDTLDLSACNLGDAGAEALALAFETGGNGNTPCVRRLVLCNNKITDQGALSLGGSFHGSLSLSNNKITDRGIATITAALSTGMLTDVSLRSCLIQADGAEQFGKALRAFAMSKETKPETVTIDLSGNPIGILRGKSKPDGSKYSASRIKSTVGATASAYMNHGLNFLKKGLVPSSNTLESDDEEEKPGSLNVDENNSDASKGRCGFKALANAFMDGDDHGTNDVSIRSMPRKRIKLGLRHTFCDTAGADALAALLVTAHDEMPDVELELDLGLNKVVEDDMIAALHGKDEDLLHEMADRHARAMEIIRDAQERAAEAARLVAEEALEKSWGPDDDLFDSDVDYSDDCDY